MAEETKCEKWRKWLVPLLSTFIVVGGGVFVADMIQRKAQERGNDIALTRIVVDVLMTKDSTSYKWLGDLVFAIQDSTLRMAMYKGVDANQAVPPAIKEEVRTKIVISESVGIKDEFRKTVIEAGGGDPLWRHIQIVFLRDDSISLERAKRICNVFGENNDQFPYQPEIIAIGKEWYYEDRWTPEFDIAEIRYNNSNAKFAEQVKAMLDSAPELGKFRLNKTNIGTPPYSVLIILPDQTRQPLTLTLSPGRGNCDLLSAEHKGKAYPMRCQASQGAHCALPLL